MFLLKIVTVIVMGLLTVQMVKLVLSVLHASTMRVKAKQPEQAKKVTRLARDPRTGIYYPEQ